MIVSKQRIDCKTTFFYKKNKSLSLCPSFRYDWITLPAPMSLINDLWREIGKSYLYTMADKRNLSLVCKKLNVLIRPFITAKPPPAPGKFDMIIKFCFFAEEEEAVGCGAVPMW